MDNIVIRGAREHNLKDIDVVLPRDKLVVITGLSGSGKSSLAFDTIYAEGQRRYVESLSAYARQFLGQMKKPEVAHIEGLSPAISIDQKTTSRNPRSTVGTVTEIYDYLRLLFAHVGTPHCPSCGKEVARQSPQEIVERVLAFPSGSRFEVLAPVIRDRKGEYKRLLKSLNLQGYARARVDGKVIELSGDLPDLGRYEKHTIEAVVDRLAVKLEDRGRITESIETALQLGRGLVTVLVHNGKGSPEEHLFSEQFACPDCGVSLPEIAPRLFSFNSPHGACPDCSGLGVSLVVDPDKAIPHPEKSLLAGAMHRYVFKTNSWIYKWLKAIAPHYKVKLSLPFKDLPKKFQNVVLYGTGEELPIKFTGGEGEDAYVWEGEWEFKGIIPQMERLWKNTSSEMSKRRVEKLMSEKPCKTCQGKRLKPEVLAVSIAGRNIIGVTEMAVSDCLAWFDRLEEALTAHQKAIGHEVVKEIRERLRFMVNVGLDYLTLSRASSTLSGGESQRIRLATQIGSGLVGVLYILDEPSIGLHQRDNARLIETLQRLKGLGNTLIVVEHDEETMRSADHLVDLGPGAGEKGGYLVAQGTPVEVERNPKSLTGQYLAGKVSIPVPAKRREGNGKSVTIKGARANNLKSIDVTVPLGKFVCVTGVSGSGKSTLITEILHKEAQRAFGIGDETPGANDGIDGLAELDKVITIDQSPIGRTPRSNPATYTGVFTPIRELFARTPDAKKRGYKPGRFSFNVKGGRCEACQGDGMVLIEMHFLPDVYVPCEVCRAARYNQETLSVRYKGKNIRDVLDMTVEESLSFFENIPAIANKMETLHDVGLGYIRLGQPATQLSGGEAQRVKLATELSKRSTGKTLYILDEPTTGLHFHDITYLLDVLNRLTDAGNTVVVIEHNLDVVKVADHLIDLGPEGGAGGGQIVAQGTPEEVAKTGTWTGKFLRPVMERGRVMSPEEAAKVVGTNGHSGKRRKVGGGRKRKAEVSVAAGAAKRAKQPKRR